MIQIKYTLKTFKNSKLNIISNTVLENNSVVDLSTLCTLNKNINFFFFNIFLDLKKKRETANVVLKDLTYLIVAWRHIRGYPQGGSTTHTNAKNSRKNKILLHYRLEQFFSLFGNKKRNIYPTLIKAEYNNRLWLKNWVGEWLQAERFSRKMLNTKGQKNSFNPALLATNQTNGYTRVGKAAKIGKSKKITKVFTIGVPVFFTRFIYYEKLPKFFYHRLTLKDDVNKKLGKKLRKKNIKKK